MWTANLRSYGLLSKLILVIVFFIFNA